MYDVNYKDFIEVSTTFKKNIVPVSTKRIIKENCEALGVDDFRIRRVILLQDNAEHNTNNLFSD